MRAFNGLAGVVHTFGLVFRMVLEGRPPVTNLYSSAIFIGWGACVLGLVLERFYQDGIGAVVSASVGFITLGVLLGLALIAATDAVYGLQGNAAAAVSVLPFGYAFAAGMVAAVNPCGDLRP